jgi:molecular chaperone GrpE
MADPRDADPRDAGPSGAGPSGAGGGGLTDDEVLEAAAVAEGDPTEPTQESVDGTVGRSDLAAERDEFLDALQRVKAEFDNFKKRTDRERGEIATRACASLADKLLPVLDACEAAIGHGAADVEPIYKSLIDVLEKEGLERMAGEGMPFDPNLHDAVMHEPGEGGDPVVVESLRTGYLWQGQVVRPAMVKVRG